MTESIVDKTKSAFEKIKYPRLLMVGAAVILIGGGIAAYWALVQKSQYRNVPVGADVIPQDAVVALSLSTDLSQWQRLRQFGTPESRTIINQQLTQWQNNFLGAMGYDYQKDIQPWVAREVMVAWLSPLSAIPKGNAGGDLPTSPINKEPMAVVAPINNLSRAQALFQDPKPLPKGTWNERTYKDIKIKETSGVPDNNYSMAILGDRFFVITNDANALNYLIDTYNTETSLSDTPGYTAALEQIETSGAFARVYLNVPAATDVAEMNSVRNVPPQAKAALKQTQGVAANVTLQPDGLQFKGITWLNPDSEKKHVVENKAQPMLTRLPADTLMMMSGGNFKRLWQDYSSSAQANPLTPLNPQWLQQAIASSTGLSWEKDFVEWMAGDFSFSLVPAPANNTTQFPAGLVVMVHASNRRAAEKTFIQLDEVMKTRYKFKVEETKVDDQPVVNWSSEFGSLTLTRGWLSGNVAFLTLGAPVADAVVPKPDSALALSEDFKKAVPTELDSNNGNFFLDLDRLVNSKQFFFPALPPIPQTMAEAMRSIGVTAAVVSDRMTRYDIFVRLKQQPDPQTTPSPASPSPQATTSPSN
jgi:hypothetical protein